MTSSHPEKEKLALLKLTEQKLFETPFEFEYGVAATIEELIQSLE